MIHRFRSTRHLSVRARLAFGSLVPLSLASVALGLSWLPQPGGGSAYMLLSGALMLGAAGCSLVLLHRNVRALVQPLEEARKIARALTLGQYDQRVRIGRLDEAGRLLVALEELGDYLAVVLPEDSPAPQRERGARLVPVSAHSLERIAEQLREGGEAFPASTDRPPVSVTPAHAPAPSGTTPRLRLVPGQA